MGDFFGEAIIFLTKYFLVIFKASLFIGLVKLSKLESKFLNDSKNLKHPQFNEIKLNIHNLRK